MSAKYVVMDTGGFAGASAFVVPGTMSHAEFAKALGGKVLSAGFFLLDALDGAVRVRCYGRSVTLSIDSRPEDVVYLRQTLELEA